MKNWHRLKFHFLTKQAITQVHQRLLFTDSISQLYFYSGPSQQLCLISVLWNGSGLRRGVAEDTTSGEVSFLEGDMLARVHLPIDFHLCFVHLEDSQGQGKPTRYRQDQLSGSNPRIQLSALLCLLKRPTLV